MKNLTVFFLALSMISCTKKSANNKTEIIEINEIAKEVQIPKKIMQEIESEIKAESASITPVYLFLPLQIQLNDFNTGVLKSAVIQYNLPKGGGLIDLNEVVTGDGSFYMSFPSQQFEKLPELAHLYFVSNSPVKKIENENFGLGCGKMTDLKNNFSKLNKEDFLKLNTYNLRYVHVASGKYIFVFRQATKVYLSQVTISDSRYKKELCLEADL